MIAPPKLKSGDKVAIVSPGRWPEENYVTGLVTALKRHDLVPVIDPQARGKGRTSDGRVAQLAGPDEIRGEALNKALRDPSIKGIFFPRAGTGSYRLLKHIDYQAAAARKSESRYRSFGRRQYSEFNQSTRSKLITFRGPLGVNFYNDKMDPCTETECFELLMGKRDSWIWKGSTGLQEGAAQGELVGANLAVLNANIGSDLRSGYKRKNSCARGMR